MRPAELYDIYNDWVDKHDPKNKVSVNLQSKGANKNGTLTLGVVPKIDEARFDAVDNRGESIQAAIEKAPEDGKLPFRILIKKGLYNQKVIIDRPNIILVGENRDSCIIVGAEAQCKMMMSEYKGGKVSSGTLWPFIAY